MQNPEYNYQVALFKIKALTNLHVGSGSENYGIIDNLVQRDPATNFPCINPSSLKGALREYCRNYLKGVEDSRGKMITHIFGLDKKGTDDGPDGSKAKDEMFVQGNYRFLQADLLSIPLRGMTKPYYNATCPWLLGNLAMQMRMFGKRLPKDWITPLVAQLAGIGIHFGQGSVEVDLDPNGTLSSNTIESSLMQAAQSELGTDVALLKDEAFVELVSDYRLPVIARNNLEDGRSTNLWYEQVLPRDTRLAFMVLYPNGDPHFEAFKEAITQYPVQIGANASVGYGFCQVSLIKLDTKN